MASNKFTDAQKDLLEDLYLLGADKKAITLPVKGKMYANKVLALVQADLLRVEIGADARQKFRLTSEGIMETHRAFSTSRQ